MRAITSLVVRIFLFMILLGFVAVPSAVANVWPGLGAVKSVRFNIVVSGDLGISSQEVKEAATKILKKELPHLQIADSGLQALQSPFFRITVMEACHETQSGIWLGRGSATLKVELLWIARPVAFSGKYQERLTNGDAKRSFVLGVLWEASSHLLSGPIAGVKKRLLQQVEIDMRKFVAAYLSVVPSN